MTTLIVYRQFVLHFLSPAFIPDVGSLSLRLKMAEEERLIRLEFWSSAGRDASIDELRWWMSGSIGWQVGMALTFRSVGPVQSHVHESHL